MIYQIVHPYNMIINGDTFSDAVKNYVKFKQDYEVNQLIITDQNRDTYMKAKLNFYNSNNKKKVGISLFPTTRPLGEIYTPLNYFLPSVTYDSKEYPPTTFIANNNLTPLSPLGPIGYLRPLPPLGNLAPFINPYVYNMMPNLAGNVYNYKVN